MLAPVGARAVTVHGFDHAPILQRRQKPQRAIPHGVVVVVAQRDEEAVVLETVAPSAPGFLVEVQEAAFALRCEILDAEPAERVLRPYAAFGDDLRSTAQRLPQSLNGYGVGSGESWSAFRLA